MTFESDILLASLNIPQLGSIIHRSSGKKSSMGIEGQAHNLLLMPDQSIHAHSGLGIPDFGGFIKRSSSNAVSEWIIEAQTVDNVLMAGKGQELIPRLGIPKFTCPIITPGDKPSSKTSDLHISTLIKGAIGKRLMMRPKLLKKFEILELVLNDLEF